MKSNGSSLPGLIESLAAIRGKRGRTWTRRKNALLKKISGVPLTKARLISAYHDVLLFLVAFPDDAQLYRLATSELTRIATNLREARSSGRRFVAGLADTGIAHTDVAYVFTLPIARWLSRRFATDVELAWDDETAESALEEFGHGLLPHVEHSSMLTDRMSTRELFELAKGSGNQTVLSWIVDRCESMGESGIALFELMALRLRWRLGANGASRTFNRFPSRKRAYQKSRTRSDVDLIGQLAAPVPKPETLSVKQANDLIDVARATLSARHRETEAVTYPNSREVDLFCLPDGIDVAIYGMTPERRLSIDSFFGFVAAKNGVPVAYGGGFVYLHRLDIGLNIFREFRGGGSADLFTRILHVFVQHYRSTQIIIDSAQFGYGRAGGIQSGAFWFYYKMGFRPVDPKLAALAREEWLRIRSKTGYRTPAATLRRFTASNLVLDLDHGGKRSGPVPDMADISLAVTRHAATKYNGDRQAQARWARQRVKRLLCVRDIRSWPASQQQSFLRWCPLVALIPDLSAWSERQKQLAVAVMRAKGGPRERRFVTLLQQHHKLARALAALASAEAAHKPRLSAS